MNNQQEQSLELKNAELEKQLAAKNRELEIEAALERVRSRTMAMQHSDELSETAYILFQQFKELGENPDQATIGIINEEEHVIEYWVTMYGSQINKVFKFSIDEPNVTHKIYKGWKTKQKSLVIDLSGKALLDFATYRQSMGGAKLYKSEKRRVINVAFFSKGLINVQSNEERSEESIRLLERFAGVFDGTYTRFLDLKKAEAQAKEAQIELALERVRARTMAMQKSEELKEIIKVVYEQLVHLNILAEHAGFIMDYRANDDMQIWLADKHFDPSYVSIPYFDSPHWNSFIEAKKKGTDFFANLLSFEEKNKFYHDLFALVPGVTDEAREFYMNCPGLAGSTVLLDNVGLYIENFSGIPYTDDENSTLMRFGKVFQQTYTRFKDLEQAEEQAREAQIQLALERVRARTMAMQNSGELHEVIQLIYDQLHQLNFNIDVANFTLNYRETDDLDLWLAVADAEYPMRIHLPYFDHPIFTRFNKAKEKGGLFTDTLSKPDKNSFFKHFFKYIPGVTKERQALVFGHPGLARSAVFMKNTVLTMINYQGIPFSEAENNTLLRFGQVFDQTYTRFSDLEQAEAQAREAQIQLGLERVRAKAMAMQTSEELNELIGTVFGELTKLDFVLTRCLIMIFDTETNASRWWMANSEAPAEPMNYLVQNHKNPAYDAYLKAWKERNLKWNYTLKGKVKRDWDDFLFVDTELAQLPRPVIEGMKAPEQVLLSASFNNFGCLTLVTLEPLSDEHSEIMLRFANVFDMCYTRFNDLKQAEEQAKEAKIEASLERVRASAMAMHNSEDLSRTVNTFFKELKLLGIRPIRCGVGRIDAETRTTTLTTTTYAAQGESVDVTGKLKQAGHPVLEGIFDHWVSQTEYYPVLQGDSLKAYYHVTGPQVAFPDYSQSITQYGNFFFFREGLVNAWTEKELPEEDLKIFRRFTSVLSLTYRRYIDLKEAEAQARESQIQLALERVRARAMAMQSSGELAEVVDIVFKELTRLDFGLTHCAIAIADAGSVGLTLWQANSEADQPPVSFYRKSFDHPYPNAAYKEWKKRTPKWIYHLKGAEKKDMHDYYASSQETRYVPDAVKEGMAAYDSIILSHSFNNFGYLRTDTKDPLSENNLDIVYRFAKAFDLCYTRFTDIKQAEAQAHEAQIQLALERVRARTMAMQHSEELAETVSVLFKQLLGLGIPTGQIRTCGIVTFDAKEPIGEQWITEMNGDIIPRSFMVPYNEAPAYKAIYQWWKKGEEFEVNHLEGAALQEHLSYLAKYTKVPLSVLTEQSHDIYNHALFFSQGYLFIITRSAMDEYHDVFKRFGAVFQQSYTRFLDLKKAEEQAKESKIQLALERVRARTMAMQKSDELAETATVLFQQLLNLGINSERTFIAIPNDDMRKFELWGTEQGGNQMSTRFEYEADATYAFREIYKAWLEKRNEFTVILKGKKLEEHVNYVRNVLHMPLSVALVQKQRILYNAFFSKGLLMIVTPEVQPEETLDILKRFAAVFDQTYTRFLDLQKAEAQTREGHIQLGLERVRAAALAMHDSNDVGNATALVFSELYKLGITTIRCGVCIIDGATRQMEVWSATSSQGGTVNRGVGKLDMTAHPLWIKLLDAWKQKESSFTYELAGKELADYYKAITQAPEYHAPDNTSLQTTLDDNGSVKQFCNCFLFNEGCVFAFTQVPLLPETSQVLEKFTAVFGLTYRRYLDLKKAEAQAREAQIEAALERVRSKTMAMHNSADVGETVTLMFNELVKLGVDKIARCGIAIPDNNGLIELWTAKLGRDEKEEMIIGHIDTAIHPMLNLLYDAWKSEQTYFEYILEGDDLHNYITALNNHRGYPIKYDTGALGTKQYHNDFFFHEGMVFAFTFQPLSTEIAAIFKRFAGVFGQTYRRYLDLQKAEAAAREAQIEAALERVRSKTIAMHNSEDVADTVASMFNELVKLGVEKTARCGISIIYDNREMELWRASYNADGKADMLIGRIDMTIHSSLTEVYHAWKNNDTVYSCELTGDNQQDYFRALNDSPTYPVQFDLTSLPVKQTNTVFFFPEGCLFAFTLEPLAEETVKLFKRFAGLFGQTYRRYLDLLKAEASAREAQIEAALERVRSKTMAMHNSQDVGDTVGVMFHEFVKLGIEKMIRCGIGIMSHENRTMELWTAKWGENEKVNLLIGHLDMTIHKMLGSIYDAWKSKQPDFTYHLAGSDLITYAKVINSYPDYPLKYDLNSLPPAQFFNDFYFNEGVVFAFTSNSLSDEIVTVLKRFAGVFGQTYRRYLDLQKAENQAREAQIEAALERVRSKAMAMRSSGDLNDTANTVFIELRKLGVDLVRCGLGLMEKETHISTIHAATNSDEGGSLEVLGNIDMNIHPVFAGIYSNWRKNEDYFPVLEGKSLRAYYEKLHESGIAVPELKSGEKQYGYFLQFAYGSLYAWSGKQESEITVRTLKRFTSVISLTYTRYIELQKAESNTKEAVKQASLDRVRAEIASMRKRSDLERITPLIWDELTILGIPFIRCGVFIMDEEQKLIHTFLSTPDGKAIGAFHIPFNTSGNFEKMVDSWRNSMPYIDHWKEEAFSQFADALVKQGAISSKAQYMRTLPHEGVHLNFLPFLQGMLYVGNIEPLSEDNINLIQAVAEAFSTAYARYEDFNKLEAAKQQVDNTLSDLKATQTKLIQSEKMASLGELTAGIAHEIQNPLNFVNNFSEVNQEMIDELAEELKAGHIEEALTIAADIKDNEEKINHHGKRADGIVKGMLQHSRTGGGEKQPTNINTLVDEFLRLSYHGLRAKDKEFNAELVTHFDEKLPKVNVIPQDIGRVLLNLFNNAFYAVNQKKKTLNGDYKPEVTVTTLTENGQLIIKVKDNGTGIPDHIKEKIMQPFFTTKPTGEGTGLGLSLTYDMVVKGHGGTIQVNSKEGEGAEFIVKLSLN